MLRILIIAEDRLGTTLARDLGDRVVVAHGPEWLSAIWETPSLRASQRSWRGVDEADEWTPWAQTKALASRRGLRTHGLGMTGYELSAYRAAHVAALIDPRFDALVLCHDTDGREALRAEMLRGVQRARVDGLPILLAVAHQEAEAWVLAGFEPRHAAERDALRGLATELGFDASAEPHRATANVRDDPRDAKRCCEALLGDDLYAPRATDCWQQTPLQRLRTRGAQTGLAEYLCDVELRLLPVLTGGSVPSSKA